MHRNHLPLILGSNSPRRRQIMEMAGYVFDIMVSGDDEIMDSSWETFEIPVNLALQKAGCIIPMIGYPDFVLITADTVVILDGRIIGKPMDLEDARRILHALSGRMHEVVSGVCICGRDFSRSFRDHTKVHFGRVSSGAIDHYIENFEVMDKAGAYAIQEGIGLTAIDSIEGSFYNVMGLPVHKVYRMLAEIGIFPEKHP